MERSVKIFIGVTIGFLVLIALGFYASWFKSQKATENLTFINEHDPLLLNAKQKAAATLPVFYKLMDSTNQPGFVRFPYKVNDLEIHIWAKIVSLNPDFVEVEIVPGPQMPNVITERKVLQIATGQMEDWLMETDGGMIRGGYTTQALLQNQLDRANAPTDSIEAQLLLFQDPL